MSSTEGTEPLRTGIEILDRKLGGGIPPGTVGVLSASPKSQSELFLYEFAATRPTTYLSTLRMGDSIDELLGQRGVEPGTVETVQLDPESPLEHGREVLSDAPARSNVVVDPMVVLEERESARYRQFLGTLARTAREMEGVVLLHCLRDDHTPKRRSETLYVADLVFDLTTEVRGDSLVNRLSVPKFRGGQSVEEVLKLDLTREVEVDMSRNIF